MNAERLTNAWQEAKPLDWLLCWKYYVINNISGDPQHNSLAEINILGCERHYMEVEA